MTFDAPALPPSETPISVPDGALVVAMATYNGTAFLPAQLQSFVDQTRQPHLLLVSDDGSTDDTRAMLADFARTAPFAVQVLDGPCRGFGRNFASLLARMPAGTGWVALSDQDDIWLPCKLERACDRLAPVKGAAVYGGRALVAAGDLTRGRPSRGMGVSPSFRHAMARNYAGGNTMVLNRAGTDLMREAGQRLAAAPVHDWWIYQTLMGCGGTAIFDDEPFVIYRQHERNQIGSNNGIVATLKRLRNMVDGRYRDWTDANIANLDAMRTRLTPANAKLLEELRALRAQPFGPRVRAFARTGIHRDGLAGRLGMWASVLLGRF
ncbi:Glycosyl transferase family 2 [Jannaschia faecimaris]|uniref:Glycosyl transferase family 2 n=1 Tax=Jannaschia faecimaris TaxID=1244108 RepID=A0A1H3JML0_9RHOB|nr:glycosyltransferase [Jannaschia faecimaris]SDY41163.1 Glycosyl transferase family 2 [Jannaschia faecimaris]